MSLPKKDLERSAAAKRRNAFWHRVWKTPAPESLRCAIRDFHNETVRQILRLGDSGPGRYAKSHVIQEFALPGVPIATLSDRVYRYLGDTGGSIFFCAVGAGVGALEGRRYAYAATAFDPKWAGMSDREVRDYFRDCAARAEWDLLETIESVARVRGEVLDLGRP